MAGAVHGTGEPDTVINVGVSGPGVAAAAIKEAGQCDFSAFANTIKKIAFKITRVGQLIAAEAANRLGVPYGIIDLLLAPTPVAGDSVAEFGGLLGYAPIMALKKESCKAFIDRGGRIPAPIHSLKN